MRFTYSFKGRLYLVFGFLFVLAIIVSLLLVGFYQHKNQLDSLNQEKKNFDSSFIALDQKLNKAVYINYSQASFYNKSIQHHKHFISQPLIEACLHLEAISHYIESSNLQLHKNKPDSLKQHLNLINSKIDSIIETVYSIGHKNYGLIGKMRNTAHELEKNNGLNANEILQLRRIEKDFILRKEPKYVTHFQSYIQSLLKKYSFNPIISEDLERYAKEFKTLTELSLKLDPFLAYESSLLGSYNKAYNELKHASDIFDKELEQAILKANNELSFQLQVLVVLISLVLFGAVIFLPRSLSISVLKLNNAVSELSLNEFKKKKLLSFDTDVTEISNLKSRINALISAFHKSAHEREKALELAKQKDKAKSEFLSTMSHEIRTPLNGVTGIIQSHKDLYENNKKSKEYGVLKSSINHLIGLVNLILEFSKIEAQKVKLVKQDVNLFEKLNFAVSLYSNKAEQKRIYLKYEGDIAENLMVKADDIRLVQILSNLINNAVKFTKTGGVTLKTETISETEDFVELEICVHDTGVGIAEDKYSIIMNAFEQQTEEISKTYGGTGLGLKISDELLKLYNSKLEIKSKIGVGSCFFFRLKLNKVEVSNTIRPLVNEALDLKGMNILVAEDNEINRTVLTHLMSSYNANLDFAENGKIALKKYLTNNYEAILMDIRMPEMDGFAATKEIVSSSKYANCYTPISALSASAFQDDKDEAKLCGMEYFISKPINAEELDFTLRKMFSKIKTPA